MSNTSAVRLTVRVRNHQYRFRNNYAYPVPEFNEYTGTVVEPKPKWVADANSFCLTTGDPKFPIRVIDRDAIVDGYIHSSSPVLHRCAVVSKNKSYIVKGTTKPGSSYVVTEDNKGNLSCNCTGFSYRKTCSHVEGSK